MVHPNEADSVLASQSFVKDWWDYEGGPADLQAVQNQSMARHLIQTPMIKKNWDNADPATLQATMTQFFQLNPNIPTWEFGLEENINNMCCSAQQLNVLVSKFRAVQAAKIAAGHPEIQVAYQIVVDPAQNDTSDIESFLASPASTYVDVLALHPYAWSKFGDIESWHDTFINRVRSLISQAGRNLKIMYTEVGAPTQNPTGGSLLDAGTTITDAQTPVSNAAYLVKFYVLGWNAGVSRIYWYQYQDSCTTNTDAECQFGMIDGFGNKKPTYTAYKNLVTCMDGKSFTPVMRTFANGVRSYEFPSASGASASCIIAWTYPATSMNLNLRDLTSKPVVSVTSMIGTAGTPAATVNLNGQPTFIQTQSIN